MEKLKSTTKERKFSTINALTSTKRMAKQLSAIKQQPIYYIIAQLVEKEYKKFAREDLSNTEIENK
tara:strand:+ start:1644 stop:1841 length:198 start_codon:yes stop_codon:yes gene_type:complete